MHQENKLMKDSLVEPLELVIELAVVVVAAGQPELFECIQHKGTRLMVFEGTVTQRVVFDTIYT